MPDTSVPVSIYTVSLTSLHFQGRAGRPATSREGTFSHIYQAPQSMAPSKGYWGTSKGMLMLFLAYLTRYAPCVLCHAVTEPLQFLVAHSQGGTQGGWLLLG